jgi:hypothetical protein
MIEDRAGQCEEILGPFGKSKLEGKIVAAAERRRCFSTGNSATAAECKKNLSERIAKESGT